MYYPEIVSGTHVRFKMANVVCPDTEIILEKTTGCLEVTGRVVLLSDAGKEKNYYAVVEVNGIATPLISDPGLAAWALGALIFFLSFPQGTNVAAFQLITPNQMRAQVSAVFMLLTNVFGLGFGATAVAVLTDYVFGAPEKVNYSLALFSVLVGVPALLCLIAGLKPYRASIIEAERWMAEG